MLKSIIKITKKLYQKKFFLLLTIIITLVVFVFYRQSLNSYFEGDEWVFFRFYAPMVKSKTWFLQGFINTFLKQGELNHHLTPISNMLYVIQYRLFGLNFKPYIIFSLITHILTSISFAYFVYLFSKSKKIAVLASLLFTINASQQQAITWVVASLYTQLAVGFGFLSLSFLIKNTKKKQKKYFFLSLFFLLLALWSKETALSFALIFPILFIFFQKRNKKKIKKSLFYWLILMLVFALPQIFLNKNPNPATHYPSTGSFIYQTLNKISILKLDQKIFRFFALGIKSFSQNIVPSSVIAIWSEWITNIQFPYFNLEKEVRGTNYLNFIQTAAPEFISYIIFCLFLIFFIIFVKNRKHQAITRLSWIMCFLGAFPILAITFRFPWWGYSSIIDSRHLYHLTPFIMTITVILFIKISKSISEKLKIGKNISNTILFIFISSYTIANYYWLQNIILKQQTSSLFSDRIKIINTLQEKIKTPPKKMIIHTTSNKSFYGFAEWMLPFQTSFAHILPIIFSNTYYNLGLDYPNSFFSKAYLPKGGLVTQGYFEDQNCGLGYFLEKIPLIKVLEKYNYSPEIVYSFYYDGDKHVFDDKTINFRKKLNKLLESRKIYQNWQRYGNKKQLFSFQADSNWTVVLDKSTYTIFNADYNKILEIEIIFNPSKKLFSTYVSEQIINGIQIDQSYITDYHKSDLDKERIKLTPNNDENIFFTYAGANNAFYKITIFKKEEAKLVLRTLEFIDNYQDKISL